MAQGAAARRDGPVLRGRPLFGVVGAVVVGGGAVATVAALTGGAAHPWSDGFRWLLYMAASAGVTGLLGLIFGIPRARTDATAGETERYASNSNLEQISDWLTKLLVGAGLVQLGALPGLAKRMGAYLGAGLSLPNGEAYALTAVAFGGAAGFLGGYLWVRLRLRTLLERNDAAAAAAAASKGDASGDSLVRSARLTEAYENDGGDGGHLDQRIELSETGLRALAVGAAQELAPVVVRRPPRVLWVDDYPSNNTDLVRSLRELGIVVDLALTTAEGMTRFTAEDYQVVITDLGRKEAGEENPFAGLDLVQRVRERDARVPIIVYAGRRGLAERERLLAAGASEVTDNPAVVFEFTTRNAARR